MHNPPDHSPAKPKGDGINQFIELVTAPLHADLRWQWFCVAQSFPKRNTEPKFNVSFLLHPKVR